MQVKEKALPIIQHYKEDLTKHDRASFRKHPGIPFLHFTGDTGTYLFFLQASDQYPPYGERVPYLFGTADRRHILKDQVDMIIALRKYNRQDLILYFDGRKLKQITQDEAEGIAKDYQQKILNEWKKQFNNIAK
jgi:hypothetical protein